MKRLITLFVLCLLLAGCGAIPDPQEIPVELPIPVLPTSPLTVDTDSFLNRLAAHYLQSSVCHCGMAFGSLSAEVEDYVVFRSRSCLVWKKVFVSSPSNDAMDTSRLIPSTWSTETVAAISGDGSRVTGVVRWVEGLDGLLRCESEMIQPIEPVEDLEALADLPERKLLNRLGTYHFSTVGSLTTYFWLTQDGKLLSVNPLGAAELTDLLALAPGIPVESDPGTVFICNQPDEYNTMVENEARWNAFLETTARGEPDQVNLRIAAQAYDTNMKRAELSELYLSYDGSVYTINDENGDQCYSCLIVDVEHEPAALSWNYNFNLGTGLGTLTHYLLSDDPSMTWVRYFHHLTSNTADPNFPATRILFSVYRDNN